MLRCHRGSGDRGFPADPHPFLAVFTRVVLDAFRQHSVHGENGRRIHMRGGVNGSSHCRYVAGHQLRVFADVRPARMLRGRSGGQLLPQNPRCSESVRDEMPWGHGGPSGGFRGRSGASAQLTWDSSVRLLDSLVSINTLLRQSAALVSIRVCCKRGGIPRRTAFARPNRTGRPGEPPGEALLQGRAAYRAVRRHQLASGARCPSAVRTGRALVRPGNMATVRSSSATAPRGPGSAKKPATAARAGAGPA